MKEILIYSVALPLLITTGVLLAALRWFSKRSPQQLGACQPVPAASGAALAGSYLVCHWGLHGRPIGDQLEAWEWLLLLVPLAAVLGIFGSCTLKWARWSGPVLTSCLAVSAGWFLVPSFQPSPWIWRVAVALSVFVLVVCQQYVAKQQSALLLVSWILIFSIALPVLIASANAKFGFFATSVAAAAGGTLLVCVLRRVEETWQASSSILVASLLLSGLLFSGYFNDYGEVPLISFLLLVAAPLGLLVGTAVPWYKNRPGFRAAIGFLVVLGFCGASVYFAWPAITADAPY